MSQTLAIKPIKYVIGLAFFMEAVDSTALNTAIPAIANSLMVNAVNLKIALISYLLSLAVFIPISGWIADKFGTKKTFMTALIIFTISSCCCGFASNLPQLVIARLFQGLGGALSLPVGRLIILQTYNRTQFIVLMNQIITIAAMGLMLGPVIGGFITHYFSWHWIFWINIPIGIFTIGLTHYCVTATTPLSPPPLDIWGFIFFGSGLATLSFGLSALSESWLEGSLGLIILGVAVLLLIAYWIHSKRQPHPIVNTHLFTHRTFRISVIGNLCTRLGFGGIPFILPLLFQINLHYSPQMSGLLIAPLALGVWFSKRFTMPLFRLYRHKKLLIFNTLLSGGMIALFGCINSQTSVWMIASLTGLYGFLISLQYSAMNSLAYADIAADQLSAATSVISAVQQIAITLGVALSALALHFASLYLTPDNSLTITVFHTAFYCLSALTILSVIIFFQLQSKDGHQMLQ